ncbi:hypothetical protein NL676_015059 [Syzygium grande]|nr:hypothetical protein NL676_015059 [Syzygium grande]
MLGRKGQAQTEPIRFFPGRSLLVPGPGLGPLLSGRAELRTRGPFNSGAEPGRTGLSGRFINSKLTRAPSFRRAPPSADHR